MKIIQFWWVYSSFYFLACVFVSNIFFQLSDALIKLNELPEKLKYKCYFKFTFDSSFFGL